MTLSGPRLTNFASRPSSPSSPFKPPSDAATTILRTLTPAFFAFAFACTFPTAWQPVVCKRDSYQGTPSKAAENIEFGFLSGL
jgi:hypothetical protein